MTKTEKEVREKIAKEIEQFYIDGCDDDDGGSHAWSDLATWEVKDRVVAFVLSGKTASPLIGEWKMTKMFCVLKPHSNEWLADDEKTWTTDFLQAAQFRDDDLALDIGSRECFAGTPFVVVEITDRQNPA